MEKNYLIVFRLYQRWFRRPRIFVKSHFLGRYRSVVLEQQLEDRIKEVSDFFKKNSLIFAVDQILHSQGKKTLFKHFKDMKYTINIIWFCHNAVVVSS